MKSSSYQHIYHVPQKKIIMYNIHVIKICHICSNMPKYIVLNFKEENNKQCSLNLYIHITKRNLSFAFFLDLGYAWLGSRIVVS